MGSYVPTTAAEREEMLAAIGVDSLEGLYKAVPQEMLLRSGGLNIPEGLSELEVREAVTAMAEKNKVFKTVLRGAGAYRHFIPSVVKSVTSREELVTCYTPYQAEISQGVLQGTFEFQTMICELTGMDVSNASHYDGATAAAETIPMCKDRKRTKAYVSACAHPQVIEVMKTYCFASNTELFVVPAKDGKTDLDALKEALGDDAACFYLQQPNYFGQIEDAKAAGEIVHAAGAKFVMGVNPIACAILPTPRAMGADVAVGDGQPLGLDTAFGGPFLGFMATTSAMTRKLPGRIVGQTKDVDGEVGYVLTLSAREQHIRREKASSNICSNQALCAFAAGVYMAAMGEKGMKQCARLCTSKAHYFASELEKIGCTLKYKGEFFHEFVTEVECPNCRRKILDALEAEGILGGAEVEGGILWCVTELASKAQLDRAVAIDEIKKFVAEQELQADKRYIPKVITHRGIADPYPEKIAIIGAGPAGLSCAYYLANMGYENVTVFDKNEVPGGMLTLGIPSFRLEKDVVNAEIEVLREMGVHFQCGVEIGKDLTIDQLREQGYKGFYLAIGAQKSAPIGVPGEDLSGVYGGVDFLRKVNLGKKPRIGKKCAVIGGGNVAMDVCRTAIRLGAKDTYIIYRRSQAEMPADAEEVAEAMEEGVQFRFLSAPAEILGENGKVKALKVEIMELGEPDAKGRRKPVGTGKFETIEVTSVIGAIGQRVDLGHIAPEAMAFNRNGTVQADGVTYQTAQPDIFAGGDVVTGPKFAIDAIAAGREGAISLHRYVHEGQSLTLARDPREFYELDKKAAVVPIDCFDAPARQTVAHDASKAKTFSNDRITFTEAQVKAEASRCLGCGVSVVDQNKCIGCGLCTTRCEFDAIHLTRDVPEASRMTRTEDKMKAILPQMVKRAAKLTIKDIKGKRAK